MNYHQNNCVLGGNLGVTPVLKTTKKGAPWCELAVYVGLNDKKGTASIARASVFGSLAKACAEKLRTGSPVIVTGRYRVRTRVADGVKHQYVDFVTDKIDFCIPPNQGGTDEEE